MRINSPYITGSATITGNLCVQGTIIGTITGVASTASYAETLDGLDSTQFVQTGSFNSYTSSASSSIGSLSGSVATTTSGLSSSIGSLSSSVATTTSGLSSSIGSLSGSVATTTSGLGGRITTIEGNYATTGSNTFIGNQVITGSICSNGNIVTTGQIVAQTINVQQVTSSIVYSCGSNIFGTSISNTQQFTGSILATGSLTIAGPLSATTIYGSTTICSPVGLFSGCVGVGTASPAGKLDVYVGSYQNLIFKAESANQSSLRFNESTNGPRLYSDAATEEFRMQQSYTSTGFLSFYTGPTERMRITCAGSVGIGTSSPNRKLEVASSDVTDGIRLYSTDTSGEGLSLEWRSGFGPKITADIESDASGTGGNLTIRVADTSAVLQDRLHINNAGNVGIGTSSPNRLLDVSSGGDTYLRVTGNRGNSDDLHVANVEFYNSNSTRIISEVRAITGTGGTQSNSGQLAFYTNNAGTYAERMRITSGGNVGIGTAAPGYRLETQKTTAQAPGIFINQCSSDEATIRFKSTHSAMSDFRIGASILVGSTFEIYNVQCNKTNYMVNCLGFSKISNDGTFVNGNNTNYHSMNSSGDLTLYAYNTNATGNGILSNVQSCSTSYYSFRGFSDPYGDMAFIYSNGTFGSRTGTYGSIVSDARCKTEICDASSQWSDIKNLRVRNFKLIEDVENDPINAMRQIGFIAQEVETVSPGLVFESGNGCVDSGCWKNVKTSIIHTKAVKALQEAMCRIEILESCLGIM